MNTKQQKKPLTIEERICLAEEGYDKFGSECRLLSPPVRVDEEGQPLDWPVSPWFGYGEAPPGYWESYEAMLEFRCPAPYLDQRMYTKEYKLGKKEG